MALLHHVREVYMVSKCRMSTSFYMSVEEGLFLLLNCTAGETPTVVIYII
jgi:hypothetical protein